MKKQIHLLIILLTISPLASISQMLVDNTILIEELVIDSLVGENITISNVLYNGAAANVNYTNVGAFNSSNSNIPILSGIVMATGSAEVVIGPNNSGTNALDGDAPEFTDEDIDSLINGNYGAHDLSVLEFDFIPEGNFISIAFVFSSEEYNEYVCAQFNDGFGIFLSGPGITGPYSNSAINIALIPETDIPVSINTVNNGTVGSDGDVENCSPEDLSNSAYFTDNEMNNDTTSTQMDGFTLPLFISTSVQLGETYHLKIAIADAADDNFDSAVFIKSNSLKASTYDPVGIRKIENKSVFQIYPNPSKGNITIDFGSLKDVDIKMFNLSGQIIYSQENINSESHQFEVSEPSGIYILEISSTKGKQYYKVVLD